VSVSDQLHAGQDQIKSPATERQQDAVHVVCPTTPPTSTAWWTTAGRHSHRGTSQFCAPPWSVSGHRYVDGHTRNSTLFVVWLETDTLHIRRSLYGAVKCRLIWHFRGQALLLRVLHVVACDSVRDCVFLKDDLSRVKKGLSSYEMNFSLPTNSQNKLTKLN